MPQINLPHMSIRIGHCCNRACHLGTHTADRLQRLRFQFLRSHVLEPYINVFQCSLERLAQTDAVAHRAVNEQWALDIVQDALATGRKIRVLSVLDVFTREALALEIDTSLPGSRVVRILDRLRGERSLPSQIVRDNGPEVISRVLEERAHQHAVTLHFIDPGKPIQNANCESFHGRVRDECLNEPCFLGLGDARRLVEAGGRTTIRSGPTVRSATRLRSSSRKVRSWPRLRGQRTMDSHTAWTKQRGQVITVNALPEVFSQSRCDSRVASRLQT